LGALLWPGGWEMRCVLQRPATDLGHYYHDIAPTFSLTRSPLTPKTHPQTSSSRPPGNAQHKASNIPLSAPPGPPPLRWQADLPIPRSARGLARAAARVSLTLALVLREGEARLLFEMRLLFETRALRSRPRTTSGCSARTSGRGDSLRSGREGVGKCYCRCHCRWAARTVEE